MRALVFLFIGLSAQALKLEPSAGITKFLAVARPSGIQINGKGDGPKGDIQLEKAGEEVVIKGDVQVDLSTMQTGIDRRDEHMQKALGFENAENKVATLKFADAKVSAAVFKLGGDVNLPATLLLHGQEKPITVAMKLSPEGDNVRAVSKFMIQLTQYGIEPPKFMIMKVDENVEITAETRVSVKEL